MSLIATVIFGLLGLGFLVLIYKIYKSEYELTLAYNRYIQAYRLKILKTELGKRQTTFEELDKMGFNHTGLFHKFKGKKTHDLDQVEKSVKGEVERTSSLKVSEKK